VAATLTPPVDAAHSEPEREAMPLINPITVSMALAVVFLVVMLAVVTVAPTDAHELRGADEAPSATARVAAVYGSD
jgi:hypothetical protein